VSHIIEVNEGVVEATRQGVDWWCLHRQRLVASGKLRDVVPACIVGGIVALGPYDEDDARFMADHMVDAGGMPRTAVRVKRAPR
jgi:hypothetical protein